MSLDRTQQQSTEDQRLAQQLSLQRTKPPTEVPGYDTQQFIGSGAYGEVWRGVDHTTGRDVAIKFYTHRGGLDWSLLSREVEKLRFLSADRYVVQLLDVGWNADPPYYVMEYVAYGSLNDLLSQRGPLTVDAGVEVFHELAVGLMHAHGKGVLHCDLKPANVLLDQDGKPRLADFGQSRLSNEQLPALGTLFYMAPEQADLDAVPDACWDVYALGAILYCLLTGSPPHRDEGTVQQLDTSADLNQRLEAYRTALRDAPPPSAHRSVRGIDRTLVDIVDRCLAVHPGDRFANVQELIDALRSRDANRARRPLLMLGFVGPIILLGLTSLFALHGYNSAMEAHEREVIEESLEKNVWTATTVATNVSHAMETYFSAVRDRAEDDSFRSAVKNLIENESTSQLLAHLSDPDVPEQELEQLRATFAAIPARGDLEAKLHDLLQSDRLPNAASWFVTSTQGTHLAFASAAQPDNFVNPVGKNYAYRSYFHGGADDLDNHARRPGHIRITHLSTVFESTATRQWKVAVSTPIFDDSDDERIIAIVAMTLELGQLEFKGSNEGHLFAVLVEGRQGKNQGVLLQHPLYKTILPTELQNAKYRINLNDWSNPKLPDYVDPLGNYDGAAAEPYRKPWLAAGAPVMTSFRNSNRDSEKPEETGLLVLVQEDKTATIENIHRLGYDLVRLGCIALGLFLSVVGSLWFFVIRGFRQHQPQQLHDIEPSMATSLSQSTTSRSTER